MPTSTSGDVESAGFKLEPIASGAGAGLESSNTAPAGCAADSKDATLAVHKAASTNDTGRQLIGGGNWS